MKKTYTIICICLLTLMAQHVFAQVPQGISYQAVARNRDGQPIVKKNISVRFFVLDNSADGKVIFSEAQRTMSNEFGLFTLVIGKGSPIMGKFDQINWAGLNQKFLKVEITLLEDSYSTILQGTTQLLSVPYALYAEKTNLVAGKGISIKGNTISVEKGDECYCWVFDECGINSSDYNVGIKTSASCNIALTVDGGVNGVGSNAAMFTSNDTWHTNVSIKNNSTQYNHIVGGPYDTELGSGNYGFMNGNLALWTFVVDGGTNYVGFGSPSVVTPIPKSTVHVFTGDVNIEQIGSGVILKSPNGSCWRVTIDNSGNLVTSSITCP